MARQLKSEMETSVEVMLLEPGRLDPGRHGDFGLKAIEGWQSFKWAQECLWRERLGEATNGVQPGAGPRTGPRPSKHSPVSHCSSQAGTSHRSAPGTRTLAVGEKHVRPCCWVFLPAHLLTQGLVVPQQACA